jgi:cellulose synthase/poly-beta-1,6-N-acetylglucosamine synthase-like glycosyltransferase
VIGLHALQWTVLGCLAFLAALHLVLVGVSTLGRAARGRHRAEEDYETIAASRFTIPVSVVVAAFDDEEIVSSCVRSLLAVDYPEHEVIVVDDGSTDATLARLRRDFGLEPYELFYRRVVPTASVRAIYRSADHPNLVVVDKKHGGRADALNAGLALARYRFVAGADARTIFEENALLRAMGPVVRDPARVVGVTCPVTVALDPERTLAHGPGGRRVDRAPLVAFQHVDRLRALFDNRRVWSRLGLAASTAGSFQLWRRDLLEEVGGFAASAGDEVELTLRVHERLRREGGGHEVHCLPEHVGATKAAVGAGELVAQTRRRQRTIAETAWRHRRLLLNPRHGRLGLFGMPLYVLSECLAPILELVAYAALPVAIALGALGWQAGLLTILAAAFANGILSARALFADDRRSRTYRLPDLARLVLLAPLELVLYRPLVAYGRVRGVL